MKPELAFAKGLHIAGTQLNLDAPSAAHTSIVTNPCIKGLGRKARVVMTPGLADAIGRPARLGIMPLNFGRVLGLGRTRLRLYPSGFSKGSAMALIDFDGTNFLYASFMGIEQRRSSAEMPKVPKADVLVLSNVGTEFDEKNISPARAMKMVMPEIESSLSTHDCALLLPELIPDALEMALALRGLGVRVLLHGSILKFARRVGIPGFNAVKSAPGKRVKPAVVLWPYALSGSKVLSAYKGPRFIQPGGQGDIQIPFSGRLDPWRLMKLVRMSRVKKVLVFGRLSQKAVRMLESAEIPVRRFWNPDQLTLL